MENKFMERDELIALRERCLALAGTEGLQQAWERDYLTLADAADHLDARLARSSIGIPTTV